GSINRFAHDSINRFAVQFVIHQVHAHKHRYEETEEIRSRQPQVLNQALRLTQRQIADNRRKSDNDNRKNKQEVENFVTYSFLESIKSYDDDLAHQATSPLMECVSGLLTSRMKYSSRVSRRGVRLTSRAPPETPS